MSSTYPIVQACQWDSGLDDVVLRLMPRRAYMICKSRGCSRIATTGDGHCARHEGDRRPGAWSSQSHGYGHSWRSLRAAVLERDNRLCQPCRRAGRLTVAAEVDHIAPRSLGGAESPENLQSICKRFRRSKTASEGATARHRGIPRGDISMVKL